MLKCVCNVVKSLILKTYLYFAICYGVHYNVSLLYIQFIPAFVILFWCAISDYNQIPGYVPITNAVPNWKKDMIIKKNEEKVREYVVNNWYSFIYKLETGINDSDCVPCMLILLWNLMKFPFLPWILNSYVNCRRSLGGRRQRPWSGRMSLSGRKKC